MEEEKSRLRAELLAYAVARGIPLPEEDLTGKRLLRLCLDRSGDAQVRRSPIARDEAFVCLFCGCPVPAGGRRPRDHCPACLSGRHVDGDVPGDRASACGGRLVPISADLLPDRIVIRYRCAACGAERRNRALSDLDPPDDPVLLRRLVSGGTPG